MTAPCVRLAEHHRLTVRLTADGAALETLRGDTPIEPFAITRFAPPAEQRSQV